LIVLEKGMNSATPQQTDEDRWKVGKKMKAQDKKGFVNESSKGVRPLRRGGRSKERARTCGLTMGKFTKGGEDKQRGRKGHGSIKGPSVQERGGGCLLTEWKKRRNRIRIAKTGSWVESDY